MANTLLALVIRLFTDPGEQADRNARSRDVEISLPPGMGRQPSAAIFLVLRRMRAPLILLISVFAVGVLGLSLIPGQDDQGRTYHMTLFESFYFMAYTATTIGFGEIPYTFTPEQRMWATLTIFLSVVGWAYAIASLLALVQDQSFRRAVARRRFARQVARMREPFLVIVGYGQSTKRLARSLDDLGHRFVILDRDQARVTAVDLDSYRSDTPAMVADARDTSQLVAAGLGHAYCEGVVALTGEEESNFDVAMTTALLRPQLPVIARAHSREVAERMRTFGNPQVINPFDRFGDHLRILHRSPAGYQLMVWLTSAPGTPLPQRHRPLPRGRWVVYGHGRFGRELTDDLRAEGIDVTVVRERRSVGEQEASLREAGVSAAVDDRRATDVESADLATAEVVVAATESDTTNLWVLETAHRLNPDVFVIALENRASNLPLFEAVGLDFGMRSSDVIAHEVMARLANPALMDFLQHIPRQDEAWSAEVVARLVERCGAGTPEMWGVHFDEAEAPALTGWLALRGLRLGDLMRSPDDRDRPLHAVPLALLRDGDTSMTPDDGQLLKSGDQLLLAGRHSARRELDATMSDESTAAYVVEGRVIPSGWVWRKLSRQG